VLPPGASPYAMRGDGKPDAGDTYLASRDGYVRTDSDWRCPSDGVPWSESVIDRRRSLHELGEAALADPSYGLWHTLCGADIRLVSDPMTPLILDASSRCARPEDAAFRHPKLVLGIIRGEPGLNVAFADGHVAWVSKSEWERRFGVP